MRSFSVLSLRGMMAVAVCGFMGMLSASAQGPGAGQGPERDPAELAKAWDAQALYVAQDLGLTAEQASQLAQAYRTARQGHLEAARARAGQGGARGGWEAMIQETAAARAKLETALNEFLEPDQTTKALATLGAFSRRWDTMVLTLQEMNLEEAKLQEAMKITSAYVVDSERLMASARESGDMQAVREQGRRLREKLDAEMATVLSAEQMEVWRQATAMRRGGGPGRGPQPPRPAPTPNVDANT